MYITMRSDVSESKYDFDIFQMYWLNYTSFKSALRRIQGQLSHSRTKLSPGNIPSDVRFLKCFELSDLEIHIFFSFLFVLSNTHYESPKINFTSLLLVHNFIENDNETI